MKGGIFCGMPVWIGAIPIMSWSSSTKRASRWQPSKWTIQSRAWPSSPPSRLCIGGTAERREEMACIIETTHGLLIAALLEAGLPVYPVNPKTVDRHRKPAGAKTDAIAAYLLARTGRSDFADLRRLRPDSALIQELKTLTREEARLIASQTRQVEPTDRLSQDLLPCSFDLVGVRSSGLPPWPSSKPIRPPRPQHKPPWKILSWFSSRQSIGAWPMLVSAFGSSSVSHPYRLMPSRHGRSHA